MSRLLNPTDVTSYVGVAFGRERVCEKRFAAKGRSYNSCVYLVRALALSGCLTATALAAELNAELEWARQITVSVPFTAQVETLNVQPAQAVEAGQLLLQLDARVARAQVAQARSELKHADLQREEAQREWDRARELFDRTVLSERELQVAEISYAAADMAYQAARAHQVAAEIALDHHSPKAPFSAWVLAAHVVPGQTLVNAHEPMPLVSLAERGRMTAHASLNAAQVAALKTGEPAQVRIGDQPFDAQIVEVGITPQSVDRPALYNLVVEFTVPMDTMLRAGQPATLVLP